MSRELFFAYILTLVALCMSVAGFFFLPPQIPLWYSLAIPEQQLVPKVFIFFFPSFMLLLTLTHTLIIRKLRSMDATIIKIFSFGTTLANFIFMIALIHIVSIFL